MQIFRSIQDDEVVQVISCAEKRVIYVAPGVSSAVTNALEKCIEGGNVKKITIVLDADEDSCRLGYCDAKSLERLVALAAKRNIPIRRHPGLRLGLLMADDAVLIWSPTPLMFEAPRTAAEPNGLMLTPDTLTALPASLGIGCDNQDASPEIGTGPVTLEEVAGVVEAIKAAPPAPFDISRLTRVFSAKFQFIETVLRGAELTKREMRLDSLILNSDAPEELQALLHTTIQPFNMDAEKAIDAPVLVNGEQAFRKCGAPIMKPTTQAMIRSYWSELSDRYIINVPGFGKIIRLGDKVKFEEGKEAFEIVLNAWVEGFKELLKEGLDVRVMRVVALIEHRMANASKRQKLPREEIESLVRRGLDNLRVISPGVKVIYKNITVESTRDKEFLTALSKEIPEKELENWFKIFDAAPMVKGPSRELFPV